MKKIQFFNFRSVVLIRPAGTDSKALFVDPNLIPRRDGSAGNGVPLDFKGYPGRFGP